MNRSWIFRQPFQLNSLPLSQSKAFKHPKHCRKNFFPLSPPQNMDFFGMENSCDTFAPPVYLLSLTHESYRCKGCLYRLKIWHNSPPSACKQPGLLCDSLPFCLTLVFTAPPWLLFILLCSVSRIERASIFPSFLLRRRKMSCFLNFLAESTPEDKRRWWDSLKIFHYFSEQQ